MPPAVLVEGLPTEAALLVDLAELVFQFPNERLDTLMGLWVVGKTSGYLPIAQYPHFQLNAFVLGLHGTNSITFL
ncbi:hypothetical protein IVB46_09545 [Bradyrhizobium sp. 61]|uniref:hypothetical protein n=1 Tax=Bradyrhizobium sp. 61 TaxID=2782679 RepID=UPI001FF93799|nr:hypothetical protein [Bradyrhizobium sp. 61]MCK1275474.1 hypothetical protein [Bradyrhizobium sp. 61]